MASLSLQMRDWRLTTAEILYHLPDHPHLLQSFTWQEYDLPPQFPQLRQFLDFWNSNLDGKLHSVKIAHLPLVSPGTTQHADCLLTLQ
ncbi:MAG: Usg family protein [Tistlia sp.]|uniref:Usg family protein n=1 Tax=Tistlia sp. TaxID=3057121 RepID=UPI0034A471C4